MISTIQTRSVNALESLVSTFKEYSKPEEGETRPRIFTTEEKETKETEEITDTAKLSELTLELLDLTIY